ncbi:putative DNA modification/repair radical SAM protein [Anaerocolumna xylanovorans DSM 12503]|uniref:Putative DNA modification/repair radical SAM protein n=1 Tax=Anaerocolumna xylanovorans DSM 12503 TaxID=1121345 RepID=A0A1M7YJA3_9FIRM|nr:putative DNA modification/repair radical SAM protein [Anaerocolumna xylanovorans]SHO52618.1 putative DNA modification/repair radical SAM protein [Anaerocolumna xylanovorans DSM 12503]
MSIVIQENMTVQKKLEVLSDAAKYDVACTSSGVDRTNSGTGNSGIGNSLACGICHTFSADGRCISLLKILLTNECIFDCKYCMNRASNDVLRATFTPEEICGLTIEFYRRNYIEGLFLSSGVLKSPDFTMELMLRTLRMLREEYQFNGYIHCKAVPGADPVLVEMAGWYADRMSVNLELPTADSLRQLAPNKTRKNILRPMKQIQIGRMENRGKPAFNRIPLMEEDGYREQGFTKLEQEASGDRGNTGSLILPHETARNVRIGQGTANTLIAEDLQEIAEASSRKTSFGMIKAPSINRGFVPAGQSTQMIIGATPESDYQIISVAEALYQKFDLKRVFYSAYISINEDSSLPALNQGPPLLREHRLYQADWLLRFYGFRATELLSENRPNFNILMDPKCNWAIGHLEQFPIEVNKADYYTLLRVPGIGVKSAQRIVKARKTAILSFEDLKKMGIVLKRAIYFITCNGRMMYPVKIEENYITSMLLRVKEKLPFDMEAASAYKQLSLFDDVKFASANAQIGSFI